MSGNDSAVMGAKKCMDCKDASATITIRKRELCDYCFTRFVNAKVLRRMERYKLRNAPKDRRRRLLLPLSYGPGSLALLHMLDAQLHKHATSGAKRTAFDLLVLVVNPGSIDPRVEDKGEDRLLRVKEKYARAEYTEVKLEDVFEYDKDIVATLAEHGWAGAGSESAESNKQRLDRFRSQVVSPTSRRDIDRVLLTRLITSFAKGQDCEGILWGDCDTTLAARALANVSKGRGFSLSWEINDGMSPTGLFYNFPMRDLFGSELDTYASVALSDLKGIMITKQRDDNLSNRHMSIEQLMETYVETQAEKYPGVMANIARTVAKLETGREGDKQCALCLMPLEQRGMGQKQDLCYGCARSAEDIRV